MVAVGQTVQPTVSVQPTVQPIETFNSKQETLSYPEKKETTDKKISKKQEKKFNQDNLNEAVKKYKEIIENSAVKNNGLSWDNVVTDLANFNDAKKNVLKSIPIIGNYYKTKDKGEKSAINLATNMGTGALKTLEGVADTASDLVFNPAERKLNYAYDYITKGKKSQYLEETSVLLYSLQHYLQ